MSEQRENKHNYGDGILFSKQTFHTTCMTNRTKYLEFFCSDQRRLSRRKSTMIYINLNYLPPHWRVISMSAQEACH